MQKQPNRMNASYNFNDILNFVNLEVDKLSYAKYNPKSLFDPITYILSLGGKRIRPALALMSYNLYNNDIKQAMPIAMGIEIFHNFTLLHDDLMDRADVRRGKETVHIKWDDNCAVLSGDAMLIEAYKEICKVNPIYLSQILSLFSETATEICCGQQLDMEFEKRFDVTLPEYIEMIRLKTAVLLGCALYEGALVGGADESDCRNLYDFGINIGLVFQIKDDLLDIYGNPENFGKRIGGDILCNKKTYFLINALEDASAKKEIIEWIEKKDFDENEKIKAVTTIFDRLALKKKAEGVINEYYQKAITHLKLVKVDDKRKKELFDVSENLMFRNS